MEPNSLGSCRYGMELDLVRSSRDQGAPAQRRSEALRCSPGSRCVPVTNATAIFTLLSTVPGLSQYSASCGVTLMTRMFGSSGLSHQTFAGIDHSSLILARSLLTSAV